MAEGGGDIPANEKKEQSDEEELQEKVVKRKTCTNCGRLVAGHPGRCGKKCKLERIDKEVELDEEDEEEDENEEDTEESGEEEDDREKEEEDVRGKGKKVTSTPRNKRSSVSGLQYAKEKDGPEMLAMILQHLQRLETRIERIENNTTANVSTTSTGTVPIYNVASSLSSPTNKYAEKREKSVKLMNPQDFEVPAVETTSSTLKGLQPVADNVELAHLKLGSGIPEKTIKSILRGEFCDLEWMLLKDINKQEEYESYMVNGVWHYKLKQQKPLITNMTLWCEAWGIYENMMAQYHGLNVFQKMHKYKCRMYAWVKSYQWPYVYTWDKYVRENAKSIDFCDYDVGEFTTHFPPKTCIKDDRCDTCGIDHGDNKCPFRSAPSGNAGARRTSLERQRRNYFRPDACYDYNFNTCTIQGCRYPHICKGCGGYQPYLWCRQHNTCSRPLRN